MGDHKKKGQRRIIQVSPRVIQGLRESLIGRGVNRAIVGLRNMLRRGETIFDLPLRRLVSRKTGENTPEMQAIRDMSDTQKNFQFSQDNVRLIRAINNGAVSPSNGERILTAVKNAVVTPSYPRPERFDNGTGRKALLELFPGGFTFTNPMGLDMRRLLENYDTAVRSVSADLGNLAGQRSALYDALQLPLSADEVKQVNTRLREIQIEARDRANTLNRFANQFMPPREVKLNGSRDNKLPPKGSPGRRLLDEIFHDTSRVAFQSAEKFGRQNAQALGIVGAQRSRIAQRMEAAQRIDQSGL